MMRFKAAIATTAVLVASLVGLMPGSATAAPDATAMESGNVETPMQTVPVAGVEQAGDEYVISFVSGREVRLSAEHYAQWSRTDYGARTLSRIASGEMSAANETWGNCGMEYLHLYAAGYRELTVATGWRLIRPVLRSEVWVDIYDNGGHTERYYGTGWDDGAWDVSETLRNMTSGIARGYVDIASYAILSDGAWCFTLAPSSWATIR